MSAITFVDTNILVYSRDARALDKRARAFDWLERLAARDLLRLNLQVINEYASWLLRTRPDHPVDAMKAEIDLWRRFGDAPLNDDDVDAAWIVRQRSGFQWFDCLLIAAAINLGCGIFLSEDMIDGMTFEGLTIVNPFTNDFTRVPGLD